jgi:transcriptional regulator with XRE-family HTH domain
MVDPAMFSQRDCEQRSRPLLRKMLGDVLRRTRLEQGRTLASVARIARVSMPYLSELERGRKEASSEVLAAICDALRIDLSDLLAEVGRDLVHGRDRRPPVLRLDSFRDGRRVPSRLPGSAEQPREAADILHDDDMLHDGGTPRDPADMLHDGGALRGYSDTLHGRGEAIQDRGDAVCLLAA